MRLVVTKLQGGGGGSEVKKNKRSSGQRSWEEQPVFPEGGGRGIKKCVGGEQIFSEVASKSHYRNLKYFSCLLCADYKAATVKINVGKKKEREVKFTSFFLSFAAAYQIL